MNWLSRQNTSIKIVLIGITGLMGLTGCLGKAVSTPSPSPPAPEEWLQPPKSPEVVLGAQELQVKYIGRIPLANKNPEYTGPVWDLISVEVLDAIATINSGVVTSCELSASFRITNGTPEEHRVRFTAFARHPISGSIEVLLDPDSIMDSRLVAPGTEDFTIRGWHYWEGDTPWCTKEFFSTDPNPGVEASIEIVSIDGMTEEEEGPPEFIPRTIDVWEVSNPTVNALAPYYVRCTRDQDGFLLSSREWGICASQHGSLSSLYGQMFLIPPGESIIVTDDLTEEEVAQGAAQELTVQTLEGCWFADYFGVHYDPNVRLIGVEQSEEALTLVIENAGSGKGHGLLYVNVYTQDGTPIWGDLVGHAAPGGIPAGEKVKTSLGLALDLPDKIFDTTLGEVRLEFVWLGLSK